MGDQYSQKFNLPLLLAQGDLDIALVAAENGHFTVGKYFDLLSKFVEAAPKVIEALTAIIHFKAVKNDFQTLADMKKTLEGLCCRKFTPVIGSILDTYEGTSGEKGNVVFAADCAKTLLGDFERLYLRIMKAVNPGKSENLAEVSISDGVTYGNYHASFDTPLKVVLENLIHEEANRKLRILAVDDAPVILKTISVALSGEYKVYTLSNPLFVEKFLQQITPELFLLDYKMPGLNGFELIPIIRKFEEHKDTPIIFLTSMGTNDYVSAAAMLGASDFVIKPFQGNVLREKIAKHIVRKKLF